MADVAVQQFLDQLTGKADPAATLRSVPTAWLKATVRAVSVAREAAKLPRVTDELIDQVTGGERPRDLTGILNNGAAAIDNHPEAAAAVSSPDTVRGVAEQRTHLVGYTGAGAAVQQFGEFGNVAMSQALDQDVQTFLATCERVAADPSAPTDLRAEANNALLKYQGTIDTLNSQRDDVAAYGRAVAEEAKAKLKLSTETAEKLDQVNGFLARFHGPRG